MNILVKLTGALVIVVTSFLATLWLIDWAAPSCTASSAIHLTTPFESFSPPAPAYTKMLPALALGDASDAPSRSKLLLCEDGKLLGPKHTAHGEIVRDGRGRYSHWGKMLIFSTSDNSDPNRNGRRYSIVER